jgi:hypothetical protein
MLHLDQWEYDEIQDALRVYTLAGLSHDVRPEVRRGLFHEAVDRIDQILLAARARRVRESPAATFSPPPDDSP